MIESIAEFLRRYNFARQVYRVVKRIDFSFSIPQITPISIRKSRFNFKRINLVIPSINREHHFGGVSTALDLFKALSEPDGNKIRTRICLTDATPGKEDLERFPEYRLVSSEIDTDEENQILPIVYKHQRKIFVTAEDRFLPTSWWTAYCTIQMVRQQAGELGRVCNKMAYLIQDYEPGFYNWSSHFALAEATYRSDVSTVPVFNTGFLRDYFHSKGYRFEAEFVFEPRLNALLKKHLHSKDAIQRKKIILIYGRPSVARNCFPLIVEALRIWSGSEPDIQAWEPISIGENHKTVSLGKGKQMKSLGKLSLESYASLLSQSAVGLSLMVSPHPSYPPLEMAHFGLLTLTNTYANKNLSRCHENIFSIDTLTPDRIAEALLSKTRQFSQNPVAGAQGKSLMPHYLEDTDAFPFAASLSALLFRPLGGADGH